MKTNVKIAGISALLTVTMLACSSCNLFLHTVKYDKENNLYIDKSTGISYTDAPLCYEAGKIGDEYARWHSAKDADIIISEIEGVDPRNYLTADDGIVLYAEGQKMPTLDEMNVTEVLICAEDVYSVSLASMSDKADIAALIKSWENGEEVEYQALTPSKKYTVKFLSEDYPWLYYNLIFFQYSDGSSYLYCRDDGRCVKASAELVEFIGKNVSGTR